MYRNDDPTTVSAPPAVPSGAQLTPGFFSNGNPGSGLAATIVPDWWLNQQQEEPLTVLTAAGVTPQKGLNNQLLAAMTKLYGGTGALGASGWMTLPGGLIVQWGTGGSGANGYTAVSYTQTFPNARFLVLAGEQNAIGWAASSANPSGTPSVHGVYNITLSGFELYTQVWNAGSNIWVGGSGVAFGWIALGH